MNVALWFLLGLFAISAAPFRTPILEQLYHLSPCPVFPGHFSHKGDIVTVSKLAIKQALRLADLRHPKKTISPFELEDNDLIQLYKVMPLLTHLGEELAKPVLPREAELEYLASQYLCELVKDIGFHGVIYRSSLEDGDNYAIFHDESVECVEVSHYKITDSRLTSEPYVI